MIEVDLMNEKVKYWIEMAEYDLETASAMLDSKRYLYVGFMLHQCIEKSLKALFIFVNNENQPPYTHSLLKLAQLSQIYDEMAENHQDLIDILEPLNIEARYPTHKDRLLKELSDTKCRLLLNETEAMFTWINNKLTKAS